MVQWRQSEMPGQGLSDIGESVAPADVDTGLSGREGQNGNAFPGMLGAFPCGIATMVGRQDSHVAGPQPGEKIR